MTEKRFTVTQDFEEHHRQIRDNGHIIMGCFVEPQAEVIVDLLNAFHEENEQLKFEKEKWKQQCIHFKEMLDDMAIAYLEDEWIFKELQE